MYAIIKTGGKQYRVQPGDVIRVEKLELDLGATLEIKDVVFIGGETTSIGQPLVANASVTTVITRQDKHKKILVFKKKRRQGYRKMQGHRQPFTELFVKAISFNGKVAKAESEAKVVDAAQFKADRLEQRTADRVARTEALVGTAKSAKGNAKKAAAAAPKKATAKKATAKKAAPKKKTAKKTTTAKKAKTKK